MNILWKSSAALFLVMATASFTPVRNLCAGFLPENDMKIPIRINSTGGISETEFNEVLDVISNYYTPIMAARGGTLTINRNWTDDTVNASAQEFGSTWILNMYGGLARHPVVTKEVFYLVACHETGHHLGGAPKISSYFGDWASNEGEADYYATLNCLRFVWTEKDNQTFVDTNTIDPILMAKCGTVYTTQPEKNLCMRVGTAGLGAGYLFQAMRKETTAPRLDTPDMSNVTATDDAHPATQCRTDTYYQGGICYHDLKAPLSDTDPNMGTCNEAAGQKDGVRPHCWFKP